MKVTDPLGHTRTYTYDAADNQTGISDALGHRVTKTYDAVNRVVTEQDALGNTTSFTYDEQGNVLTVTDALSNVTTNTYDAIGQLKTTQDAGGGTVSYTYDANGNRTAITDANSHTGASTYDELNRLKTSADALGNKTTYRYDAAGNRTQVQRPTGVVISYTYDALNRPSGYSFTGYSVTYTYDAAGNRLSMTDPTGATGYTYDALNRLATVTSPGSQTVRYQYDAAGNRTQLQYPDGKTVTSAYDAANRLTHVTDGANRVTSYTYDVANRLTNVANPNGTTATYSFDEANRVTSINHRTAANATLIGLQYTYNKVGNRTYMVDGSGTTAYTYDDLQRLTNVTYPNGDTTSYAYDAMGNRTSMTVNGTTTSYSYDAADRLTNVGGTSVTWDANGSMLTKGGTTYTYDTLGRLTGLTGGMAFTYDGDGKRQTQTVSGTTTSYIYDIGVSNAQVLQETTGTAASLYTYGLDRIAMIGSNGAPTYYHADALGSPRVLTEASGASVATYTYDAFGALRNTPAATTNTFRFTGEHQDASGLVYLRARYYDPSIGRFISRDTFPGFLGANQSLNRYAYAYNNPVNLSDPTGNSPQEMKGNGRRGSSAHRYGGMFGMSYAAFLAEFDSIDAAEAFLDGTAKWRKRLGFGVKFLPFEGPSRLFDNIDRFEKGLRPIKTYRDNTYIDARMAAGEYGSGDGGQYIANANKGLNWIDTVLSSMPKQFCFGTCEVAEATTGAARNYTNSQAGTNKAFDAYDQGGSDAIINMDFEKLYGLR